jgi:hypothetical protein
MIHLKRSLLLRHGHHHADIEEVRAALQSAIELEHSTIPPYLYAMYSLDPAVNKPIIEILRSAVIEEMLHMALAANVLNAIGGTPSLRGAAFIPRFPSHLPGGIEGQLTVHLRPFSMEQLKVFVEIEEPRSPLVATADLEEAGTTTIGEFYYSIERAVDELGEHVFTGDPARQVGPELMGGSISVTDVDSANAAINTIIAQGEGTSISPGESDLDDADLAHYYRFMQVHEGRRLVRLSGEAYGYEGEALDFDADGVAGLPEDPHSGQFAPGSDARALVDEFNDGYGALLGALDRLFNGSATSASFDESLSLMYGLGHTAREMVRHTIETGEGVGPTFETAAR